MRIRLSDKVSEINFYFYFIFTFTFPLKELEEDLNKCKDGLSAVNFSIPVQIIRNDNFLEIWVKRNDKYDIFETYVWGGVCNFDLQSSRDASVLVPRAISECLP